MPVPLFEAGSFLAGLERAGSFVAGLKEVGGFVECQEDEGRTLSAPTWAKSAPHHPATQQA